MSLNQFKPFATGDGANTLDPVTYASQGYVAQGFQPGIASSAAINTALRQASTVVAALAQFTADNQTADVFDDGIVTNFETKFKAALSGAMSSSSVHYGIATGTGDAMVVTATTPMVAATSGGYQPGSFLVVKTPASANATTAPTVNANSIGNIAITRAGSGALAVGDIPATTWIMLFFDGIGCYRVGLTPSDIASLAPTPGVTSKGGLAKDSGGNFLLALGNLNPDGAAIAGGDILALQRASDGTLLSGTVAQIAAFILAQQALYGASANGGLAKDGSNNFGLNLDNLPVETGFNANDKLALFTEEAEDGLASGVPFAGTLGALAAFIASFITNSTSGSAFNAPGVAVPKIYAWGFIDNTSGVPVFKNGSGVSSVAIGSTSSVANVIVVNLTNPLPDLNYTISASIVSDLSTNRALAIQEAFNSRTLQSFALAMSPPGVSNNGINAKFSFLIYHT